MCKLYNMHSREAQNKYKNAVSIIELSCICVVKYDKHQYGHNNETKNKSKDK